MVRLFVLNVSQMIIVPAHVKIRRFGCRMYSKSRLMQNGCLFILNYALGAKKQLKEALAVTLWRVYAVRVFATSVQDLGNPITKIISSVTFLKRVQLSM